MGQMAKSYANINTYILKGQSVVSAKAFNRKDANTDAQKVQRASFKLISDAYQSLGGFASSGLPVRPEKQSAFNYFMQLNLPNAIDTSGDTPVIDFSLLQVAKGTLPGVNHPSGVVGQGVLTLSYESKIEFQNVKPDDVLRVIVKKKSGALYTTQSLRGSELIGTVEVAVTNATKADIEFVYVFLTTKDGMKASNSVYVPVV